MRLSYNKQLIYVFGQNMFGRPWYYSTREEDDLNECKVKYSLILNTRGKILVKLVRAKLFKIDSSHINTFSKYELKVYISAKYEIKENIERAIIQYFNSISEYRIYIEGMYKNIISYKHETNPSTSYFIINDKDFNKAKELSDKLVALNESVAYERKIKRSVDAEARKLGAILEAQVFDKKLYNQVYSELLSILEK